MINKILYIFEKEIKWMIMDKWHKSEWRLTITSEKKDRQEMLKFNEKMLCCYVRVIP